MVCPIAFMNRKGAVGEETMLNYYIQSSQNCLIENCHCPLEAWLKFAQFGMGMWEVLGLITNKEKKKMFPIKKEKGNDIVLDYPLQATPK